MCNIKLQNEAHFTYCRHSINLLFSIVITTITITTITITITTITITTIRYFTLRFFPAWAVCNTPRPTVSEARSTVTSLLEAKPACQRGTSEYVRVVRPRMSELWEQSQIQSFLPAQSKSRLCATSKAISTATSLLQVRTDQPLRAKPVSPVPAQPYPPLPACSQQSRNIRKVRISMSEQ